MRSGPDDEPVRGLVNPYRDDGPVEVRGASAGRLGLAAGVIAVVVPSTGAGAADTGATEVWMGPAAAVAQEIGRQGPTAGYLWPAEPEEPVASPALDL